MYMEYSMYEYMHMEYSMYEYMHMEYVYMYIILHNICMYMEYVNVHGICICTWNM